MAGETILKTLCFLVVGSIAAVFAAGCDGYKEIEFPAAIVRTTNEMHPWGIESKKDIPQPIYISRGGKSLKLDTKTTVNETKTFLKSANINYKETIEGETVFHANPDREHHMTAKHFIEFAGFELYYRDGLLHQYFLSTVHPEKILADIRVDTSAGTGFSLPLKFEDVKQMFGNRYTISDTVYK